MVGTCGSKCFLSSIRNQTQMCFSIWCHRRMIRDFRASRLVAFHFLLPTSFLFGPQSDAATMQTAFVYDCTASFVRSCVLIASRSTGKESDPAAHRIACRV